MMEWKPMKSFRGSALPVLIHALGQAHAYILEARNEAKQCPF